MVHDRVPRFLYEHPVVEYIPLEPATRATGPVPPAERAAPAGLRPALMVLSNPGAWRRALADYRYAFPPAESLPPLETPLARRQELHILAIGFRVSAGIYRANRVNLAAATTGPIYHLFTFPLKYFYKPMIDFVVFNTLGNRLAEARGVDLGPGPRP